jgi:hypothetical protein
MYGPLLRRKASRCCCKIPILLIAPGSLVNKRRRLVRTPGFANYPSPAGVLRTRDFATPLRECLPIDQGARRKGGA